MHVHIYNFNNVSDFYISPLLLVIPGEEVSYRSVNKDHILRTWID